MRARSASTSTGYGSPPGHDSSSSPVMYDSSGNYESPVLYDRMGMVPPGMGMAMGMGMMKQGMVGGYAGSTCEAGGSFDLFGVFWFALECLDNVDGCHASPYSISSCAFLRILRSHTRLFFSLKLRCTPPLHFPSPDFTPVFPPVLLYFPTYLCAARLMLCTSDAHSLRRQLTNRYILIVSFVFGSFSLDWCALCELCTA
ncbi:hypothetical protein BKA82DRAFT_557033 [Pisolithus tinctorius]|uniref:Uncharacterized protein n=1 Tax=Pisolithus tinctorius Marx 270 TaxID=870435 RepID=A0A0C3P9K7_PISTI|nr:hypothetical protein BKA82DRAFT_557033 [Pisolithus tinctorius]KIO04229.1 hypothetical protein M404DRAFT_557033 [Pisolithus tinctorius Marx 270]